jgi:hypothetical protein
VVTVTTSTLRTATPSAAGSGYVVGDFLTVVQSGASGGTVRVSSVNGSGGITGLSVINIGKMYSAANGVTLNGGTGTGATANISTGLLTDGSLANAVIKLGTSQTSYTISTNTASSVTLTSGYNGTDCTTSCAATVPSGQGTGVYIIAVNMQNGNCSVYNTYTGQVNSTGSYQTGSIDSGCHNMHIHDGFLMRDGIYGQWSGASTGISCGNTSNFWQTGTTHAVSCTGVNTQGGGICGGHETFGYHNETSINNPNFQNFDPANANSNVPFPIFGSVPGSCENHFSWRNATSGDTEPIILSTANNNYSTSSSGSSWIYPGQNEVDALTQGGTLIRFGHNFILGPGNNAGCGTSNIGPFDYYFTAQYAIGSVSQDGRLFSFSSSMLGQLGQDADSHTRSDLFVYYLGKP